MRNSVKTTLAVVGLAVLLGCTIGPGGGGGGTPPEPPNEPPAHGEGFDPNDGDFYNPATPPEEGLVTYEVRAQIYNSDRQSLGGFASVHIDATPLVPGVTGGVAGGQVGPFPYDNETVVLPFQFPIFIEPGITVTVSASFTTSLNPGETLACWLVGADGVPLDSTRDEYSVSEYSGNFAEVDCFGNFG